VKVGSGSKCNSQKFEKNLETVLMPQKIALFVNFLGELGPVQKVNCEYLKKKGSNLEPVPSPRDILEKKFKKVLYFGILIGRKTLY
jgi:hypothetical protein